jgi:radical SAM/Cys-rich protein
MKTLAARNSLLSSTDEQLRFLEQEFSLPSFSDKLEEAGLFPLRPTGLKIFQVNVGKMCNQVCVHCHVDAGPERKEIMSRETMMQCLTVLSDSDFDTVDITGGAPELNPHFRWFVEELDNLGLHIIVRCNLTILVANKKYNDLPHFYKDHNVEVISSLPFYNEGRTDKQRGTGVFKDSITAIKMLNEAGYGKPASGLILNLVYNPSGAFLPASQAQLEKDFKNELKRNYDVDFNKLYCITNMPISRYLDYLINSGNYNSYMERLVNSFNAGAAEGAMCRNTLSVSWDGYLHDCDFNQMLDLKIGGDMHIRDFNLDYLNQRSIITNQHCYGCTAGSGSSCGGATT